MGPTVLATGTDQQHPTVIVNQETIYFQTHVPVIVGGELFVPIGPVFEAMGFLAVPTVGNVGDMYFAPNELYNLHGHCEESSLDLAVSVMAGDHTVIVIWLDRVNGRQYIASAATRTAPFVAQGQMFAPIQVIADAIGATTNWNITENIYSVDINIPSAVTTLPNRVMTDGELFAWIASYRANGGISELERAVVYYINVERARVGAPSVVICEILSIAARFKSQEMVDLNYFAHVSPVYGSPTAIPHMFGAGHFASENLARRMVRDNTALALVEGWMNSPGHRANMLDPGHRYVGAGVVVALGVGVNFDGTPITDRYAAMGTTMFGR